MAKPNPQPQLMNQQSYLIMSNDRYSPEDIIAIADYMTNNNIVGIEIGIDDYSSHLICYECRMETEKEAQKRYERELKKYKTELDQKKRNKESEKAHLIKQAKKLGLKVVEQ